LVFSFQAIAKETFSGAIDQIWIRDPFACCATGVEPWSLALPDQAERRERAESGPSTRGTNASWGRPDRSPLVVGRVAVSHQAESNLAYEACLFDAAWAGGKAGIGSQDPGRPPFHRVRPSLLHMPQDSKRRRARSAAWATQSAPYWRAFSMNSFTTFDMSKEVPPCTGGYRHTGERQGLQGPVCLQRHDRQPETGG
jgi:hypothetical protein